MPDSPQSLLSTSLLSLGIEIPPEVQQKLISYLDYVLKANEKLNLTSIEYPSAVTKHLVDSLAPLQMKDMPGWMEHSVDLGSGAGFPGIPLAMAVPSSKWTLIESTQKKAKFLEECVKAVGLESQISIRAERAELLGKSELKAKTTLVACRAVGSLTSLLEMSAPMLRVDGRLIAYKGPKAEQEIIDCSKTLKAKNCIIEKRLDFKLPISDEARTLVVVKKLGII